MSASAHDLWTVAQTLVGEARGEPFLGQVAVAWVIRNRQEHHVRWQGMCLADICTSRAQFSCWNAKDPNRPVIQALTLDDPIFVHALHVALTVLGNEIGSPVGLATHFYAGTRVPAWAKGKTPVVVIGRHRFFEHIA
jgi:hypothetical protein